MAKYPAFFLVILGILFYGITFRDNNKKIKVKILGKEREISLGLLLLSVFLDGAILGFLLFYLVFYA
ncbi:MAG: hypothetical protein ACD_50C00379G0002 [uncultured bacterium]|nr:MAG: hypothetical protein ACD_50C00379G0002 [uncultured bacterium]